MDKIWTMERNVVFAWDSDATRMWRKYVIKLKEILVANGWVLLGVGMGTGTGQYNFTGTDTLPAFPSVTGTSTDMWVCLRAPDNGDGMPRPEVVIQQEYTSSDCNFWWRPEGGYTSAGIGERQRPTAGTGSENAHASNDKNFPVSGVTTYWNFAVAADGSFMAYNYSQSRGAVWHFFLRCVDTEEGDDYPYAAFWRSSYNYQMIDNWQIGYQNGAPSIASYHPTLGKIWTDESGGGADKGYGGSRFGRQITTDIIAAGLSPVDGSPQMMGVWVMSWGASAGQRKGRLPDVFECHLSNGDKVNGGDYIQVGHYLLPWMSATDNLTQ